MNDQDPVVDEARQAGDAYVRQFDHDLKAVFADLRRRTEEARRAGRTVVSMPPRRVQTPVHAVQPTKKAS
jgi:hypothetical protein